MKIPSDFPQVQGQQGSGPGKHALSPEKKAERPAIPRDDTVRCVIDENRAAAGADPDDVRKAEEAIAKLRHDLMQDISAAAEVHRLPAKGILSFDED